MRVQVCEAAPGKGAEDRRRVVGLKIYVFYRLPQNAHSYTSLHLIKIKHFGGNTKNKTRNNIVISSIILFYCRNCLTLGRIKKFFFFKLTFTIL